jgi:hypothetical protein
MGGHLDYKVGDDDVEYNTDQWHIPGIILYTFVEPLVV